MANKVTLEDVQRLVNQLPSEERLKLAARIYRQSEAAANVDSEITHSEQLKRLDAWLAECDVVAESVAAEFDAAEDIRQVRSERSERL